MLKGTCLMELYIDQDPQDALKNIVGNFDEEDLQKAYAQAQVKNDETVIILSISSQIGRKLQSHTKTTSPPGHNIAQSKDPSITSGLTQEAAEDEDISILGRASLALDPERVNIPFLGYEDSLTGVYLYSPGDESL